MLRTALSFRCSFDHLFPITLPFRPHAFISHFIFKEIHTTRSANKDASFLQTSDILLLLFFYILKLRVNPITIIANNFWYVLKYWICVWNWPVFLFYVLITADCITNTYHATGKMIGINRSPFYWNTSEWKTKRQETGLLSKPSRQVNKKFKMKRCHPLSCGLFIYFSKVSPLLLSIPSLGLKSYRPS